MTYTEEDLAIDNCRKARMAELLIIMNKTPSDYLEYRPLAVEMFLLMSDYAWGKPFTRVDLPHQDARMVAIEIRRLWGEVATYKQRLRDLGETP